MNIRTILTGVFFLPTWSMTKTVLVCKTILLTPEAGSLLGDMTS